MPQIPLTLAAATREDFLQPGTNYPMSSTQQWGLRFGCRGEKITPTKIGILFSLAGTSTITNYWNFPRGFNEPGKPYASIILGNTIGLTAGEFIKEYQIN